MTSAEAFTAWWNEQSRKGDPSRVPNLAEQAFHAGFVAGLDETLGIARRTFAKEASK